APLRSRRAGAAVPRRRRAKEERVLKHVIATVWLVPVVALAQGSIAGDWLLAQDMYGNSLYRRMSLTIDGTRLSGTLDRQAIEGTITGNAIRFTVKTATTSIEFTGSLVGDTLSGSMVRTSTDDPMPFTTTWTARRVPPRRTGAPQRHEFVPTTFHRQFSASIAPVLHIWPGDTVHTTTVDAGGVDEHGVTRVLGGNPQTGPFYIETAMPGDVLAVRLTRVRLNRDWATSDDGIVGRALGREFAVKRKDGFKTARWHLARQRGLAMPENPPDHLKNFAVPVRPMLGCVAVAPGFGAAPPPTGDSGRFGGNMDFNE